MSEQQEQNELMQRAALETYATGVAKMLQRVNDEGMDPAQIELMKQGIVNTLMPPKPAFPDWTPPPQPPRSVYPPIFVETRDGHTAIYDFRAMMQPATHYVRNDSSGDIVIWKHQKKLAALNGDTAEAFWNWQQEQFAYMRWQMAAAQPRVDAEFTEAAR